MPPWRQTALDSQGSGNFDLLKANGLLACETQFIGLSRRDYQGNCSKIITSAEDFQEGLLAIWVVDEHENVKASHFKIMVEFKIIAS